MMDGKEQIGVLFEAAGVKYCISVSEVSLIRKVSETEATLLPSDEPKVCGLINVSGRPIVLMNPFGCESADICVIVPEEQGDFAFLADRVIRTVDLPCDDGEAITAGKILERMK